MVSGSLWSRLARAGAAIYPTSEFSVLILRFFPFLGCGERDMGEQYSIATASDAPKVWIFNRPPKLVIGGFRRGKPHHHERVPCRSHQVIALLYDPTVRAVIQSKFLEPIV